MLGKVVLPHTAVSIVEVSYPDVYEPSVGPDVFMPPGVAPSTVIARAADEGPLGLPWVVWIGGAGLLVVLLTGKK